MIKCVQCKGTYFLCEINISIDTYLDRCHLLLDTWKCNPCTKTTSSTMHVAIGSGRTKISKKSYSKIKWENYTLATRKLLSTAFTRRILATHSLTGKISPAFPNRPAKAALNPIIVSDIIKEVLKKCPGASEEGVRLAITHKCADEGRAFKGKQKQK